MKHICSTLKKVKDIYQNTVAKVTCMGRILKSQVNKSIGDLLLNENILCTDAWRAYKTFAKEKN